MDNIASGTVGELSSGSFSSGGGNDGDDEGVTLIDEYAFNSCPLTAISFPAALTTIGDGAFQNCSRLASVEFPASVTSLGKNAFFNCDGLTAVISRSLEL